MRFRKIPWGSWWQFVAWCEVPRCLLKGDWGIIVLCTMFLVSCIVFSKCLYFSYYMARYFLDRLVLLRIQNHIKVCVSVKVLLLDNSTPSVQSIPLELMLQLCLQQTIPKIYPAGNFWVVRYIIQPVSSMVMCPYPQLLHYKVGFLVRHYGVWDSMENGSGWSPFVGEKGLSSPWLLMSWTLWQPLQLLAAACRGELYLHFLVPTLLVT